MLKQYNFTRVHPTMTETLIIFANNYKEAYLRLQTIKPDNWTLYRLNNVKGVK